MLELLQEVLNAAFARSRSLVREASRHGADLARGKARADQVADALRTAQVSIRIAAIAILGPAGIHKASLLVVAQHALRDPNPPGRFLDLHLDPFPRRPSTLTLVLRSSAIFNGRATWRWPKSIQASAGEQASCAVKRKRGPRVRNSPDMRPLISLGIVLDAK